MTPYIGATELSGLLPKAVPTLTGSSTPLTMGEVATIIDRIGDELDSAAAQAGYLVPVATTATQAYAQMALYTSWGAACRVIQLVFPGGRGAAAEMPLAQDYCSDYRAVIDRLMQRDLNLVGAPADTSENNRVLPRSYSTSYSTATAGVDSQVSVGQKF